MTLALTVIDEIFSMGDAQGAHDAIIHVLCATRRALSCVNNDIVIVAHNVLCARTAAVLSTAA